jgi:hypothetical protein
MVQAMRRPGIGGRRLKLGQQSFRHPMQGHDLVLEAARQRQAQRLGEAAGRGQAEAGGPHEGEELEQIEGGEAFDAEALGGGRAMAKDRARARHAPRRILGGQQQHLARGVEPGRPCESGDQHGRIGKPDGAGAGGHLFALMNRRDPSRNSPPGRPLVDARGCAP